jgi:hypothetical protein
MHGCGGKNAQNRNKEEGKMIRMIFGLLNLI